MQPNNEVVLIEDALTPDELASLLAELSLRGFRATGGRYPAGYRDNDRLVFDDPALAERLLAMLAPHLPREVTTADGGRAQLVGLNPRFRACRYRDGQSFQRHRDGAYSPSEEGRSERTLMLYLTDGAAHHGGRTRFYESADPSAPPTLSITPRAGLATVFPHDAWHDGEAVTGGTKVVLRSDLLYRRVAPELPRPSGHRGYVWDVVSAGPGSFRSVGRDGTLRAWRGGARGLLETSVHTLRLGSPIALARGSSGGMLVGSRHGAVASVRVDASGVHTEGPEQRVHRGAVLHLMGRGDGFVSAGADGVVQALDADGAPLARHALRGGGFLWGLAALPPHSAAAEPRLGMSQPDAHEWLVGGEGGRVHRLVFDGERFHELGRVPAGAGVRSLAAHPTDGAWVGRSDGRVVALAGGLAMQAHAGPVTALALLGDGRLASGGEDGRVLLWDLAELRAGSSAPPRVLAHRHDFITRLLPTLGGHVLAAGYDGQVVLLPTASPVSRSRRTSPTPSRCSAHTPG
ncbi:MAG: 2OG-Fe(II) oxygenase [Sandaracinaceae bacterium]|nr:2OG-Fe(II) oxygenase [Sandaracinaceae bacterium]